MAALFTMGCFLRAAADTQIRVAVPADVSRAATARMAGDGAAPGAILILDGVEMGAGEGFTFAVLAPASAPNSTPTVLAVTGMVGRPQAVPAAPVTKVKLVVPLNERANQILAGKTTVTLTLQIKDSNRPALRVDKAFFSTSDKPD